MALVGDQVRGDRAPRTEAVRVLGVDILRDQPFRDYRLLEFDAGRRARPPTPSRRAVPRAADRRRAIVSSPRSSRAGTASRLGGPLRAR